MAMAVPVSAKTKVDTPKYFRVQSQGERSATIRWSPRTNVSGYVLYLYDTTTNTYKAVKKFSRTTYMHTLTKLTAGKTYKYRLKAYKKVKGKIVYSAGADVQFKAKTLSEDV